MQTKIITLISALLLFSCGNKKSNVATDRNRTAIDLTKKIKSIYFELTPCYGTCPIFKLLINAENTATFEGIEYTKFIGKATKKLSDSTFIKIEEQLLKMNIRQLKDNYTINATGNSTAILSVTFDDNTYKIITDYGLEGTPQLKNLYLKFTKIVTETNWKTK